MSDIKMIYEEYIELLSIGAIEEARELYEEYSFVLEKLI